MKLYWGTVKQDISKWSKNLNDSERMLHKKYQLTLHLDKNDAKAASASQSGNTYPVIAVRLTDLIDKPSNCITVSVSQLKSIDGVLSDEQFKEIADAIEWAKSAETMKNKLKQETYSPIVSTKKHQAPATIEPSAKASNNRFLLQSATTIGLGALLWYSGYWYFSNGFQTPLPSFPGDIFVGLGITSALAYIGTRPIFKKIYPQQQPSYPLPSKECSTTSSKSLHIHIQEPNTICITDAKDKSEICITNSANDKSPKDSKDSKDSVVPLYRTKLRQAVQQQRMTHQCTSENNHIARKKSFS